MLSIILFNCPSLKIDSRNQSSFKLFFANNYAGIFEVLIDYHLCTHLLLLVISELLCNADSLKT